MDESGDPGVRERRVSGGLMATLIFLLAVAAGIGYLVYTRGWTETRQMIGSSAHAAVRVVEQTSQDVALTGKVKTALALSKRASAFYIHVQSQEGAITLTGQVPSEEVKEMAEAIARDTSGVTAVKNNLAIDPAVKADEFRRQLVERVADLEIKTLLLDSLAATPELKAAQVKIRVEKGTVFLTGTVETPELRDKAVLLAWGTEGAAGVVDNITVRNPRADVESAPQQLARRVEFNLYSSKAFDLNAIQIQAYNSTIVLSGNVRSQAEKLLAERIAMQSEGVQKVVNNLQIQ